MFKFAAARYTMVGLSIRGHLDVARLLIEPSADVNARDKYGHTALFAASSEGH